MNEKLIQRAAREYRGWMIHKTQETDSVLEVTIQSYLDTLSQKSGEIQRWANRILKGTRQRIQVNEWEPNVSHMGITNKRVYERITNRMIPELGDDIINYTRTVVSMLKGIATGNEITPISLKEAIEEIRIINQAWDEVEFRLGILSVRINKVTLSDDEEEVELGDFWIRLRLDDPLKGLTIGSINSVESEGGYYHPHVKRRILCTGRGNDMNGGDPMQEALTQGRLEDYFRLVESILRTYNGDSIHEELAMWYNPEENHENEFLCDSCEEWVHHDYSNWCEGCSNTYCESCAEGGCCTVCDDWRCSNCSITCHGCDETFCARHNNICGVCRRSFCRECLENTCASCDDNCCDSCIQYCAVCENNVCDDCKSTCDCCGDDCCEDCVNGICSKCEVSICQECQITCGECEKTICKSCGDNECTDCGVPMCDSCCAEHNCLLAEVDNG